MPQRFSNVIISYALARGIVRGLRRPKRPLRLKEIDAILRSHYLEPLLAELHKPSPLLDLFSSEEGYRIEVEAGSMANVPMKRDRVYFSSIGDHEKWEGPTFIHYDEVEPWPEVPKRNWLQRSVRRFSSMLPTWMNPSTYSRCTVVLIQSLGCLIFPAAIVVGFSEWRSRSHRTSRQRSSNTTLSRFAQRVGSLT